MVSSSLKVSARCLREPSSLREGPGGEGEREGSRPLISSYPLSGLFPPIPPIPAAPAPTASPLLPAPPPTTRVDDDTDALEYLDSSPPIS